MAVFDKNGKEVSYSIDVHDGRWYNTETLIYIEDDEAEALGLHEKITNEDMKILIRDAAILASILLSVIAFALLWK